MLRVIKRGGSIRQRYYLRRGKRRTLRRRRRAPLHRHKGQRGGFLPLAGLVAASLF